MAYSCEIIKDSISRRGHRVTTMIIVFPRLQLAEFNTPRTFSRNSASSRAIPVKKQVGAYVSDYFRPVEFGTAVAGMNAGPKLEGDLLVSAEAAWDEAAHKALWSALCLTTSPAYMEREGKKWSQLHGNDFFDFALEIVRRIDDKNDPIHDEALLWTTKGLTNRLLEPFMWHTVIVTATEWENFFNLRTDKNAQLEIRTIATMMKAAYEASEPELLEEGEWHLPFIQDHELEWAKEKPEIARKAVTARCARVSYLTHDKKVIDLEADIRLADRLAKDGHMSPFEHAATPFTEVEWQLRDEQSALAEKYKYVLPDYVVNERASAPEFSANFRGWGQFRREQPNERVFVPEPPLALS